MSTVELERENEALREMVKELRAQLAPQFLFPREWKLTTSEEKVMRLCVARPRATFGSILTILYSGKPPNKPNVISVIIWKLRKKLLPFGAVIESIWGRGVELDPATRAMLIAMQVPE
jgi:two-component system cell cycle response regulator CtrA